MWVPASASSSPPSSTLPLLPGIPSSSHQCSSPATGAPRSAGRSWQSSGNWPHPALPSHPSPSPAARCQPACKGDTQDVISSGQSPACGELCVHGRAFSCLGATWVPPAASATPGCHAPLPTLSPCGQTSNHSTTLAKAPARAHPHTGQCPPLCPPAHVPSVLQSQPSQGRGADKGALSHQKILLSRLPTHPTLQYPRPCKVLALLRLRQCSHAQGYSNERELPSPMSTGQDLPPTAPQAPSAGSTLALTPHCCGFDISWHREVAGSARHPTVSSVKPKAAALQPRQLPSP